MLRCGLCAFVGHVSVFGYSTREETKGLPLRRAGPSFDAARNRKERNLAVSDREKPAQSAELARYCHSRNSQWGRLDAVAKTGLAAVSLPRDYGNSCENGPKTNGKGESV